MELDRVVTGECPTAELTFELGVYVLLGDQSLRGSDTEGLRQFWFLHLGLVFDGHFAHVFDLEAQVGLQVGNERAGRPELRGAVVAVEHRVARVHVLQKLGPSGFPQLVLYVR